MSVSKGISPISNWYDALDVLQYIVCVFRPQLLLKFHKQQEEIRRLRELVHQRDVRVKQLELEIKNIKNSQAQSSDFWL